MSGFNKEKFAQLLNKARGDRSINQYALQSGVTSAHISRLSRALLNSPPTPQTIKKLADHAYNNVTYEDLMAAAGYLPEEEKQAKPIDTREWYNRDDPPSNIELEEFLRQSNVQFNGAPLDEEDKEDIIEFLKFAWKTLKKEKEKEKGK
ncbi:Uncharacterized [Moorella glycerini]|uniref:HTH-type transcriptional repressor RghR n=1 Tax=Neomoorella stamsii TaxID=1266720 RepID=A0A9X7J4L3_9FIRM|nr:MULTISPECIES: hypothetical protein [Moorella]PRR76326.1 HTH-type transcriptional repressor RghR [Moorella stamsii]CEP67106.1 Uncharacterized [Moorella glycerini]